MGASAADGGGGKASIANSSLTGGEELKGRKKGLPAKNLMTERRKKLNDRIYMLRSFVPKISKGRILSHHPNGGFNVAVHIDDVLDRGNEEIHLLYLHHRIKLKSAHAGGAFLSIHNSHKVMNIEGDLACT